MTIGREIAGTLNQPGKEGGFWQGQVLDVFIEVGERGLAKSADPVGTALARRHFVGIHLEDLLFAEALLKLDGDHHLGELALYRLLRREEKSARKLHRQGRTTLPATMMNHVGLSGFCQAVIVHTAMLEESPVFDGQHG